MWDGRETVAPLTAAATFEPNLRADLSHQIIDAVAIHAQGTATPTDAQVNAIVDFELQLYSGQVWDRDCRAVGRWRRPRWGPWRWHASSIIRASMTHWARIRMGIAFNPVAMTLFAAWESPPRRDFGDRLDARARAQIAAGEKLFDSAPMTISNVRGLNDNAALNKPTSFQGTCTTCHDAPNVGDHSLPLPLDIGTGHTANSRFETDAAISAGLAELSMPDLPLFLISGCPDPFNAGQPSSFYTTDPGKALITGNCSDFNRVKGPILRGLAARAPYFHNGAGANLSEVVNFYNLRFQMKLTEVQKEQLVAFLNSL